MKPTQHRGLTLVEIVIAMALGSIVVALAGSVFVASLSAQRRGVDLREAQNHARGLVDLIARDVRSASQTPGVRVRPRFALDEGEPLLSFLSETPAPYRTGPAWITYVFLPARGVVLQQVVAPNPDGGVTVQDSRVVATGVVNVAVEQVANGVAIEAEVRRGREAADARAVATPRNP
jgi:prepilin-type N-terminal cleavage/methylation domain-containing protein